MLLRFLYFLVIFGRGTAFVLRPSYDVSLEDSGEYKIGEFVDGDYEMLKEADFPFRIENTGKLKSLKKLASKSYDEHVAKERTRHVVREWFRGTEPTRPVVTDSIEHWITGFAQMSPLTPSVPKVDHRQRRSGSADFYEYDYGNFMKEYYYESIEESHSNQTYNASIAKPEPNVLKDAKEIVTFDLKARNCTEEELKHIGLKALNCIVQDYRLGEQRGVLLRRLWRICRIWLMVYVVIAVPLWCTRGWCCCCLFCKFFKPRKTISAARLYLVRNPPGVLHNRDGTRTTYQHSDYEQDSYEELEHFIRTM